MEIYRAGDLRKVLSCSGNISDFKKLCERIIIDRKSLINNSSNLIEARGSFKDRADINKPNTVNLNMKRVLDSQSSKLAA